MNTRPPECPSRADATAGFSLVEVVVAMGIAAFCLVTLLGLLPVGLSSNQSAVDQTGGATVASRIIAELRATPATSATSANLRINIPAGGAGPSGNPQIRYFTATGTVCGTDGTSVVTSGNGVSRYRANVGFVPPTTDGVTGASKRTATSVRILVTWPALSDRNNGGWPTNFQGSFETTTTLDRN